MTAVVDINAARLRRQREERHEAAIRLRADFLARICADLASIPRPAGQEVRLGGGVLEDCRALIPYLSVEEASARVRVIVGKAEHRAQFDPDGRELERQDFEDADRVLREFAVAAVRADIAAAGLL